MIFCQQFTYSAYFFQIQNILCCFQPDAHCIINPQTYAAYVPIAYPGTASKTPTGANAGDNADATSDRFYKLYGKNSVPEFIMPMSIHDLGNSSVATIPTLYNQVRRGFKDKHTLASGDMVLFAWAGAAMNINAVCYSI